jgi:predicted signal transduction protein with EAL and GGDEF domain
LREANLILEAQARELTQAEQLEEGLNRILELIARNEILESILHEVVLLIERQHQSLCCAIVLNKRGNLSIAAMTNGLDGEAQVFIENAAVALGPPPSKEDSELTFWAENTQDLKSSNSSRFLVILIRKDSEPPLGYLAITDLNSNRPPVAAPAFDRAATLTAIAIDHATFYERLSFQARHDSVANLPNRARFRELLDQTVVAGQRHGNYFAVLTLNLDRFGSKRREKAVLVT